MRLIPVKPRSERENDEHQKEQPPGKHSVRSSSEGKERHGREDERDTPQIERVFDAADGIMLRMVQRGIFAGPPERTRRYKRLDSSRIIFILCGKVVLTAPGVDGSRYEQGTA